MAPPSNIITIYGRNAVYEALSDTNLKVYALHLSSSNKASEKIDRMVKIANKRDIEIKYHSKERLSFISKNKKQDQGVALDIVLDNFAKADSFKKLTNYRILALDGIENPQNLGMIIRSAAAGKIDAIVVQKKGTASLVSPLTIKASVGTLFKIPIIYTDSLVKTIKEIKVDGCEVINLSLEAEGSLFETKLEERAIFILGNETRGVSKELAQLATTSVKIPMQRGVESLNVAVTAGIIAFL
ncbi:MAG TPA: RNA methyltransferase [Nitratifractor sp.]|nr:RNA methyltransferase [Nitratifractor sp.]HHD74686.1 RNA methyltransferase [Nitratifractor sp.]